MEIIWLNESNLQDIIGKKVFIYGFGTLGKIIGKWLSKNGCESYEFCVDEKYLVDGLASIDDCIAQVTSGVAICIYAIGESAAFELFRKEAKLQRVYAIFDPYEFWVYSEEEYNNHLDDLNNVRSVLADDLSRKTLDTYLVAKKINDGSATIQYATLADKYFNELTSHLKVGAYVDCGAYNGDTIELFQRYYNDYHRPIYAFEPDEISFSIITDKYKDSSNIKLYKKGVWDSNTVLNFHEGDGERSEVSSEGEIRIEVTSLDSVIDEPVAYVKIGADNASCLLDGMRNLIKRDMPIISMFAVYSFKYLYQLPQILNSFRNDTEHYKVYLRHHSLTSCGLLFLYAIPENNSNGSL